MAGLVTPIQADAQGDNKKAQKAKAPLSPFGREARTGSRIGVEPTVNIVAEEEAAAMRHAFGQCIYRKDPLAARALLANSDPVTADFQAAGIKSLGERFRMADCLGTPTRNGPAQIALRMPFPVMRSLLAEQAYLAVVTTAPVLEPAAKEVEDRSFFAKDENLVTARGMAEFADCVVFRDVAGADALLRTTPGSLQEKQRARALAPAMGPCVTEGSEVKLTVRNIRTYVADGLWTRFGRSLPQQQGK